MKIENQLEQITENEELTQKVETLVSWIYKLSESNNLSLKTTELAVQIIQICLKQKWCNLNNILLIAITSFFISVKYNECQSSLQFNFIYSKKDFLEMELQILNLIHFDMNLITICDLLQEEYTKYIDLILFVILDSEFWSFSKFDLYQAIQQFNNTPQNFKNQTTNKIINQIQIKVNVLTAIGDEKKSNTIRKRKKIQNKKLKQKTFQKLRILSEKQSLQK